MSSTSMSASVSMEIILALANPNTYGIVTEDGKDIMIISHHKGISLCTKRVSYLHAQELIELKAAYWEIGKKSKCRRLLLSELGKIQVERFISRRTMPTSADHDNIKYLAEARSMRNELPHQQKIDENRDIMENNVIPFPNGMHVASTKRFVG